MYIPTIITNKTGMSQAFIIPADSNISFSTKKYCIVSFSNAFIYLSFLIILRKTSTILGSNFIEAFVFKVSTASGLSAILS